MKLPVAAGLFLSVLFVASIPAASQSLPLPKIPRRVYFAPAVVAPGISDPAMMRIPDYLYTEISARQPIVRVDNAQSANSVIEVEVSEPGPSVVVRLLTKDAQEAKISFLGGNFSLLAEFVAKAARQLAPQLGFVEPAVQRITATPVAQSAANEAIFRQVRAAERLALPLELSVDGLSLMRLPTGPTAATASVLFDPTPVILQVAYFPSRSLGVVGSLWAYYGKSLSFGETQSTSTPAPTTALLLLPGVGVKYRSLGTVFATFSGIFYAGYGHVTNTGSQSIGYYSSGQFQLFLNPGASASIFYMILRFASAIGYNFTPHLAAHAGVVMNLSPNIFSNHGYFNYPSQGNSFFMQYLTLGVSYRP